MRILLYALVGGFFAAVASLVALPTVLGVEIDVLAAPVATQFRIVSILSAASFVCIYGTLQLMLRSTRRGFRWFIELSLKGYFMTSVALYATFYVLSGDWLGGLLFALYRAPEYSVCNLAGVLYTYLLLISERPVASAQT